MWGSTASRRASGQSDVGLEGQPEEGDADGAHAVVAVVLLHRFHDLPGDPFGFGIVDFTGGADEAGLFRGAVHDEPRIDGNAVTADAGAGLQDIHAGVVIGQTDEFPDVDLETVADDGQFVGKGDSGVAGGVFGELAHFRGAGVGEEQFPLDEDTIDLGRTAGAVQREAADDAVVGDQLFDHLAGQDALGAVGNVDVEGFGGIRAGEPEVGHGDEEGVGRAGSEGRRQPVAAHGGMHDGVELRLDDVNASGGDGADDAVVDIDAGNFDAAGGEHGGGRQADVAETDNTDVVGLHGAESFLIVLLV